MLIKTEESAIEKRDFLIESSTNDFEIAFVKVLVNVLVTGAKTLLTENVCKNSAYDLTC